MNNKGIVIVSGYEADEAVAIAEALKFALFGREEVQPTNIPDQVESQTEEVPMCKLHKKPMKKTFNGGPVHWKVTTLKDGNKNFEWCQGDGYHPQA